jgi:hypothetical protein
MQPKYIGYYGDIATKLITVINGKLNNGDKIKILGEIIQHKGFVTRLRDKNAKVTTKVFGSIKRMNVEYNDNLNAAKSLNNIGYDVYMIPRLQGSKSPDFILKKRNNIYLYELKTIYGRNSLDHRLEKGLMQADRMVLNIVGNVDSRYVADTIRNFYLKNQRVKEIKVLLGGKAIDVRYGQVKEKRFVDLFMKWWAR